MGEVRKDSATHNSIALSWSQVEQPSNIVDYEVKYYEKVVFDYQHRQYICCRCFHSKLHQKGVAEPLYPQCSVHYNIYNPKCAEASVKCGRLCCARPLRRHLIGRNVCVVSQTSPGSTMSPTTSAYLLFRRKSD